MVRFVPLIAFGRDGQGPNLTRGEPQLRTGELSIEGRGMSCGFPIEVHRLRRFRGACRFGRAALPIRNTGHRDRRLGRESRDGEMAGRRVRIIQEAQGNPAGVELRFNAYVAALRTVSEPKSTPNPARI